MKHLNTYFYLGIGIILSMLMVSCTDDSEEKGYTLELVSYANQLEDVTPVASRRAPSAPSGYEPYVTQHPEAVEESHAIGLFLTIPPTEYSYRRFVYETDHWKSYAVVQQSKTYYFYGFLPMSAVENPSITPYGGNFSQGATITLPNLKSLGDKDVCVITGVKGSEDPTDDVTVTAGSYLYQAKGRDQNNVSLLFDHIFSAVQFSIRVDAGYGALRTIRLKSVVLKTETAATVDASIEFRPYVTPTVTFTQKGTEKGQVVLLDTERELTTSYENLGELIYIAKSARSDLKLVSVYDIYDRYGNLLREDCVSENKLDVLSTVDRGQKRNVKLTVDPTYILQLSEDDVDNPPFVVN